MSPRSSLPWTTRRTQSGGISSRTSDMSQQRPVRFYMASIYFYPCAIMGTWEPPLTVTNLTPSTSSSISDPRTSLRLSVPSPLGSGQRDLDLRHTTLENNLCTLAESCSCISMGSHFAHSWPLVARTSPL